jgi:hypothetical protein
VIGTPTSEIGTGVWLLAWFLGHAKRVARHHFKD